MERVVGESTSDTRTEGSWIDEPMEHVPHGATSDTRTEGSWIDEPMEAVADDDNSTAGLGSFLAEKTSFWKPKVSSSANILLTNLALALAKVFPDVVSGNVPHRSMHDTLTYFPGEYPDRDLSGTISAKAEHSSEAIASYALINPVPAREDGTAIRKEIANLPDGVFASTKMVKAVKSALTDLSDEARKAVQFVAKDEIIGDAANAANITALFMLCHEHVGEIFYALLRQKFPKKGIFELSTALSGCRNDKLVALGNFLAKLRASYMAFANKGKGATTRVPSTELYVWLLQSFGMRVSAKASSGTAATYIGAGSGVDLANTKSDLPLAEMLHTGFFACVLWFDLLVPTPRGSNNDDASKFINALCSGRGRIVPVGGGSSEDDNMSAGFTITAVETVHRRLNGVFVRTRNSAGGISFVTDTGDVGDYDDDGACHLYVAYKESTEDGLCLEFLYTRTAEEVAERGALLHPLLKICGQRSNYEIKTDLEKLVDHVILQPEHTLVSLNVEREAGANGETCPTLFAISDDSKVYSVAPEKLITMA